MKKKNKIIIAVIIGIAFLAGVIGVMSYLEKDDNVTYEKPKCYSFSDIEKPVSYLATSEDERYKLKRLIDPLYKSDSVDVIYIQQMVEVLGLDESIYSDILEGYASEDVVSTDAFDRIYERIIDSGIVSDIKKETVFIYEAEYYDETESLLVTGKEEENQVSEDEAGVDNAAGNKTSENKTSDNEDYDTAKDTESTTETIIGDITNLENDTEETTSVFSNIADAESETVGILTENMYITPANCNTIPDNPKKDDEEYFSTQGKIAVSIFDGIENHVVDYVGLSDDLVNKIVTVYTKNDVIIMFGRPSTAKKEFVNVWIDSFSDGSCTFMLDRKLETFKVKSDVKPADSCVADITFDNDGISEITLKNSKVEGRANSVTDEGIRIENKGYYEFSDDFKVYNDYFENPYLEDSYMQLTGYKSVRLILDDKKVQAVVIDSEIVEKNIRVILNDTNFSSYQHIVCNVTSDVSFTVTVNDEEPVTYQAGEEVKILPRDYSVKDVVRITPETPDGRIQVLNIRRNNVSPEYYGTIEATVKSDYVYIVNEVPIEKYLYSVVSSQVPDDYNLEAMKAVAICARGYAYSKMESDSYSSYNADIDDSNMCQLYNNSPKTEESVRAVNDTFGIIPVYKGSVIYPFYFSTSVGITCSNSDIWGGAAYEYLPARIDNMERNRCDFSNESDFRAFISDSSSYDTIEKDMPFYRWSIHFTNSEMSNAINSTLKERIKKSDDAIKVMDEKGNFVAKSIDSIGEIESFEITERSESGVVMKMVIYGSENVIEVTGQTNIRNLITPKKVEIVRNDGSTLKGWTSLPSPFYYIDSVQGGYNIVGGGFGHGVGFSQNGAEILAENGYNYKYILSHYFSYISYDFIYQDEFSEEE